MEKPVDYYFLDERQETPRSSHSMYNQVSNLIHDAVYILLETLQWADVVEHKKRLRAFIQGEINENSLKELTRTPEQAQLLQALILEEFMRNQTFALPVMKQASRCIYAYYTLFSHQETASSQKITQAFAKYLHHRWIQAWQQECGLAAFFRQNDERAQAMKILLGLDPYKEVRGREKWIIESLEKKGGRWRT